MHFISSNFIANPMRFCIFIVKINAFDFLKQNQRFLLNNQALPTSCRIQVWTYSSLLLPKKLDFQPTFLESQFISAIYKFSPHPPPVSTDTDNLQNFGPLRVNFGPLGVDVGWASGSQFWTSISQF